MARAGRKAKQGRRTKSGRITQEGRPRLKLVSGNDFAEAKKARFGANGWDAIGRAFECGLLGEDGERLLDTARAVFKAYWRAYEVGPIRCAVNDPTLRGGASAGNPEHDKRREEWLNHSLAIVEHRIEFDQLVVDINPDYGPAPLDRILAAKLNGTKIRECDEKWLAKAVAGLRAIC